MTRSRFNILVIDDEKDLCDSIYEMLVDLGHTSKKAYSANEALNILNKETIDIVFCDVRLKDCDGVNCITQWKKTQNKLPYIIFMTVQVTVDIVSRAKESASVEVIEKPVTLKLLTETLDKIAQWQADPVLEIMSSIQSVSGVRLGPEKRQVVETRLQRRMFQVGASSIPDYCEYLRKNRSTEINALLSLLTTHTTEFFRESDHFEMLEHEVLPQLFSKKKLKVWSAACSTGQEIYTLAITILEAMSKRGLDPTQFQIELIGTDIDPVSLNKARNGVYRENDIRGLDKAVIARYFDIGKGELEGYYRVKSFVHKYCRFEQLNLLSQRYPYTNCDIIFLRNVLIYFDPSDVQRVAGRMAECLGEQGLLFIGHSESLELNELPLVSRGVAVYGKKQSSAVPAQKNEPKLEKLSRPISVLIVDDSKTTRSVIKSLLSSRKEFEVVGEAENPVEAEELVKRLNPDVMTLDINMPIMDGITYLEKLNGRPRPTVVMMSATSESEAISAFRCLELGAFDYIEKPKSTLTDIDKERIFSSLISAGESSHRRRSTPSSKTIRLVSKSSEPAGFKLEKHHLIAIGCSTGGVEALRAILPQFKSPCPPIVIVQHIPSLFSAALAKRLSTMCEIEVVEGKDGQEVLPNTAYIAPGGKQMAVTAKEGSLFLVVNDDPQMSHHKPSVDYLFSSLLPYCNRLTIAAALLTGMGSDGAKGMKKLRDAGVHTIAQDEETCVVYGMPAAAVNLGAACEVAPLDEVPGRLLRALRSSHRHKAAG